MKIKLARSPEEHVTTNQFQSIKSLTLEGTDSNCVSLKGGRNVVFLRLLLKAKHDLA